MENKSSNGWKFFALLFGGLLAALVGLYIYKQQNPDYDPWEEPWENSSSPVDLGLPFDPCVELVPVDAGAVSCGDAERLVLALRAPFPCLPVEALESFIGHRVGREPCVGLGMRRVLMAPPADRLQPSDQPQSTVAAQHVAQARVP